MTDTVPLTLGNTAPVSLGVAAVDALRGLSDAALRAECEFRGLAPREVDVLTGDLVRGARGLLDWSLADLATASGVSVSTLKRFEGGGPGCLQASKAEAIRAALRGAGIRITTIAGGLAIHRAAPVLTRSN